MQETFLKNDNFIYDEMITHPAIFTHHRPQHIAILGKADGILMEALKHASITTIDYVNPEPLENMNDARIYPIQSDALSWLTQVPPESLDIIIHHQTQSLTPQFYEAAKKALSADGILIHACQNSLLELDQLKPQLQMLRQLGFHDWHTLYFLQPSIPSGQRTLLMLTKRPTFRRIREKDIYNRPFTTRFYNYDMHKSALGIPEFVRAELDI